MNGKHTREVEKKAVPQIQLYSCRALNILTHVQCCESRNKKHNEEIQDRRAGDSVWRPRYTL